jgi:hypothetical protein
MKDMKQNHKSQIHKLLAGFCEMDVIIKTDFIQNIIHNKRQEMT